MLGDDQAGHDLQRLADTRERHCIHLLAGEAYRAGGMGCRAATPSEAAGVTAPVPAPAQPQRWPAGPTCCGRGPRPTILRGFGLGNPLGQLRLRSSDGDRWKLIRPDDGSLLPRGWDRTDGRRSGGGK